MNWFPNLDSHRRTTTIQSEISKMNSIYENLGPVAQSSTSFNYSRISAIRGEVIVDQLKINLNDTPCRVWLSFWRM